MQSESPLIPFRASIDVTTIVTALAPWSAVAHGDGHVDAAGTVDLTTPGAWIAFANGAGERTKARVQASGAAVILCGHDMESLVETGKTIITVDDPRAAMAEVLATYAARDERRGIHPAAVIETSTQLGNAPSIGAGATLGACAIGANATIGASCTIGDAVTIGDDVILGPGVVVGEPGFGYTKTAAGDWRQFPHFGRVLIGNSVEVGANACIDRGVFETTLIGDGTKIANLVQIAHNVSIGSNCLIAGGATIGGNCRIGNDVWIGPGVVIANAITIGDRAEVAIGSVVTANVAAGETVIGNPARPLKTVLAERRQGLNP